MIYFFEKQWHDLLHAFKFSIWSYLCFVDGRVVDQFSFYISISGREGDSSSSWSSMTLLLPTPAMALVKTWEYTSHF